MQILLASAKIMHDVLKTAPDVELSVPHFTHEVEAFARDMAQYSTEAIAEMFGCSLQIAGQNKLRFMRFFEETKKMPAILAYHGQAYKHLKAETLTEKDLNYAQVHLWITSFLYGLHRPLDGILPYRMEGSVELPSGAGENMFVFWKVVLPMCSSRRSGPMTAFLSIWQQRSISISSTGNGYAGKCASSSLCSM